MSSGLLPDSLPFGKKFDQRCIYISGRAQSKMMAVAETPKGFRANESRMRDSPFQPDSRVEPVLTHHRASKANPSLHHDARLLCVNGNWAVSSSGGDVAIEGVAQCSWFAAKVIGETITPARMPNLSRDKSVAAFRTTPQQFTLVPIIHVKVPNARMREITQP
jgi:hypothetical protein